MSSAYGLLWRDRRVLELLAPSIGGRLCFSMLPLAVVLFSRDASDSIAVAGGAAGAFGLASGALSPLRGDLVDRFGWPALAGLSVLFGAVLGVFAGLGLSIGAPAAVIALAGAAGALAPPIGAVARAVWGTAYRDRERDLQALYSADATLEEGSHVLGPLLVGGIVAVASSEAALAVAAAGVVVGGVASASSGLGRTLRGRGARRPRGRRWSRPSGELVVLVASLLGPAAALGCLEVTVPAFAAQDGSAAWAGPVLAALSAGSMIGGIWYGGRRWRRSREVRYLAAAAAFALLLVPPVPASSLASLGALLFLPGLALGPLFILLYELVDRAAPAGRETGAFSVVVAVNNGGIAVGAASAGAVVAATDPAGGLALAAGVAAFGVVGAALLAHRPS